MKTDVGMKPKLKNPLEAIEGLTLDNWATNWEIKDSDGKIRWCIMGYLVHQAINNTLWTYNNETYECTPKVPDFSTVLSDTYGLTEQETYRLIRYNDNLGLDAAKELLATIVEANGRWHE